MLEVMIVEDDQHFVERLGRAVTESSTLHLATTCGTVASALECLERIAPDVVLVDLGLPDGNGIEVIRTAARRPGCDVLVITMFGDDDSVLASIESGATGYLLKDAGGDDYVKRIEELRSGGSPISPIIARRLLERLQPQRNRGAAVAHALSKRELEVLDLLSRGFNYAEIAGVLALSEHTISTHVKQIYRKLQVHSRGEAVYEAQKLGILRL